MDEEKIKITDVERNLIDADDRAEYEAWLESLDESGREEQWREREAQRQPLDKGALTWYDTVIAINLPF